MKKGYIFKLLGALALVIAVVVGCNRESAVEVEPSADLFPSKLITYSANVIPGQYIVVMNDDYLPSDMRAAVTHEERQQIMKEEGQKVLGKHGIAAEKIQHVYGTALKGLALANLTEKDVQKLAADPAVKYLEQDQVISIQGGPPGGGGGGSCANNNSETTPCGITAANGGANYTGNRKAYVLDTGIDLDHPDLNVANYGHNSFTSGKDAGSLDDGNGHGSHVAGTIAAIGGNGIGVKGVAAGALVVPVKVLDSRGSGSTTGVIAGVNYVGGHGAAGDVANMSLGGGVSQSLDDAVVAASSGGIWFVVAAGNNGANANNYSPARANGPYVRTIAAMTCAGAWASYSNYGNPPVDWIATGSSVCSTYKSGGYASLSGTSMATPHAAGVILVKGGNPSSCGTVSHSSGSYTKICI